MLRAILCTPRGANFDLTCPYQALVSVASTQQAAACGLLQLEHAGLLCSPHSVTAMKHWSSSSRPLRCAPRFRRRKRRRRPARSRSVCSPPARAGGGSTGPRPGGGSVNSACKQRLRSECTTVGVGVASARTEHLRAYARLLGGGLLPPLTLTPPGARASGTPPTCKSQSGAVS